MGSINNFSLSPDDRLIRFVNFEEHVKEIGDIKRLKSHTFAQSSKDRDPNMGISVEVESLIKKKYNNLDEYLSNLERNFDGALIVRVGDFSKLNLIVVAEISPHNPFHGQIYGNPKGSKISPSEKKTILSCSDWLTPHTDIIIPKFSP